MGESSSDERHVAGPGERLTAEQVQDAEDEGGEVGDAIRRAAEKGEDVPDRDADEGGEVGEAIRIGTED